MYLEPSSIWSICNGPGSSELSVTPLSRIRPFRGLLCASSSAQLSVDNKLIKKYQAEQNISGDVTGLMVRHGTHILGLAAILEAGGPKGSTVAGEHEFTIPGLYTCPDSMLSPFNYGTRARIVMHHADPFGNNQCPTELPWTQFIFRGEETVEGAKARHIKSFGMDQQYIYLENHHVLWTGLQVWIGYPMRERSEVGVFAVAPCFDGSRRVLSRHHCG